VSVLNLLLAPAARALAIAAGLSAPPVLPPETADSQPTSDREDRGDAPERSDGQPDAPPNEQPNQPPDGTLPDGTPPELPDGTPPELPDGAPPELPPDGGRTSLPPGLEPVPFPLEQQRRTDPAPLDGELLPPQSQPTSKRRSIVDLRDPFNRPPPRPRSPDQQDATRLLMPDLKDPFAPGLRRVRSQRLDMYVPNDIRDPFRDRPRAEGLRPPCARTTEDGTVVQKPGSPRQGRPDSECPPSMIDLRDPFTRER
jgi:hypothetical protein